MMQRTVGPGLNVKPPRDSGSVDSNAEAKADLPTAQDTLLTFKQLSPAHRFGRQSRKVSEG